MRICPGAHPFPPIETWHWTQHDAFKTVYPSNHRSVYLMTQRLLKHPYLAIFDGPDTNASTEGRSSSTVPLQALFLMNNPFVQEQSARFARRLVGSCSDPRQRIELAHQLAWSRPPTSNEVEDGLKFLQECKRAFEQALIPDESREMEAWASLAKVMLTANEFYM